MMHEVEHPDQELDGEWSRGRNPLESVRAFLASLGIASRPTCLKQSKQEGEK